MIDDPDRTAAPAVTETITDRADRPGERDRRPQRVPADHAANQPRASIASDMLDVRALARKAPYAVASRSM